MLKDSGSRAVNSIRNMLNQLGSTLDINNMPEAKFITNLPWDCTLDQACKGMEKWKQEMETFAHNHHTQGGGMPGADKGKALDEAGPLLADGVHG